MANVETMRGNVDDNNLQQLIDRACAEDEDENKNEEEEGEYINESEEEEDPPATKPGSLVVSRLVWEIVRTCDINIRNDFKTQVQALLEVCKRLDIANKKIPTDLQTVHRLLWHTSQLSWNLSQAKDGENKLWTRYHMFKNYEEAVELLQSTLRPVAATWHSARRCQLLKTHPEIALLLRDDPLTLVVMASIIVMHLFVALQLGHLGEGGYELSGFKQCLVIFASAYLFGGFMAFGFQALDHELSHTIDTPVLSNVLGLVGSGCTTVPWYSYYFSGGHERHHKLAGTPKDIDREAFFWAWERTPKMLDSPIGSVIWASIIGIGLPILYVVSLTVCLLGNWRSNIKELMYFSVDMLATIIIHGFVAYFAGLNGVCYMILSMAFGNGFLLHPLIAFWIMQHLCHKTSIDSRKKQDDGSIDDDDDDDNEYISLQPTLSYRGSKLWNWLNFNELSHVEHHDFSRIPWTRTNKLAEIAPEFYLPPLNKSDENLTSSSSKCESEFDTHHLHSLQRYRIHSIDSIFALLRDWVFTRGEKMNFACIRAEAPPSSLIPKENETVKTK